MTDVIQIGAFPFEGASMPLIDLTYPQGALSEEQRNVVAFEQLRQAAAQQREASGSA